MRADLRPSSLGEILDRTAQMYRSHFLLYFGIAAIAYAGVLVLTVLVDLLLYPHVHANPRAFANLSLGAAAIIGLLAIMPVAVAMAAIMHAVARNYLGETCTIREAYRSVRHRWYRYILILVTMYFYTFFPIVLILVGMVTAIALVPAGATRVAAGLLVALIMLAAVIFAVWRILRWALSVPASLMENLTVHRALKRSSVLTKSGVGRIFVMLLLVGVIMMLIQYAIQIPTFILMFRSRGVITLTTQIITSLGSSLSGAFVLPIYSIALTLFYYDQRIRKEGYDVEWLMEQAAMRSDGTPAAATSSALPGSLSPQTEPSGPAI